MDKKTIIWILLVFFVFQTGCASRTQLENPEPTDQIIHKSIEIKTISGEKYTLISYEIGEQKIKGLTDKGIHYEERLSNIKNLSLIKDPTTGQIIATALIISTAITVTYILTLGLGSSRAFR